MIIDYKFSHNKWRNLFRLSKIIYKKKTKSYRRTTNNVHSNTHTEEEKKYCLDNQLRGTTRTEILLFSLGKSLV